MTTRAVAAAAGVQAPAIYRLFGDKDGLLEAVAEQRLRHVPRGQARGPPR
ncbi:TetR family transcriptional regulator [Streptomyces klenkii]